MTKENPIDFEVFRNNLNQLANLRNLKFREIAEEIGVTRTSMSRYMSGERTPDLAYVVKMADYFNVSIEWLLGLNETQLVVVTDEEKLLLHKYSLATQSDKTVVQTLLSKYED